MADDLSNKNLAKKYPKATVWVIKTVNGVRTEVIYSGNSLAEARKINSSTESVLIKKA